NEIDGDDLSFQTISRTGKTVDTGTIHRQSKPTPTGGGPPAKDWSHARKNQPQRHKATERLGFDARREAPATRPNAVVHQSPRSSRDSCTTRVGRVLGLLRRPTRRTRSASTPRASPMRP